MSLGKCLSVVYRTPLLHLPHILAQARFGAHAAFFRARWLVGSRQRYFRCCTLIGLKGGVVDLAGKNFKRCVAMKSEGGEMKGEKERMKGVCVCRVDENKETDADGRTD